MRFNSGDFARSVNPISNAIEVVMVTSTFVLGGVLFYWVTNGADTWETALLRAMPSEGKPRRIDKRRKAH